MISAYKYVIGAGTLGVFPVIHLLGLSYVINLRSTVKVRDTVRLGIKTGKQRKYTLLLFYLFFPILFPVFPALSQANCQTFVKSSSHITRWNDENWASKGYTTVFISQLSAPLVLRTVECMYGPEIQAELRNIERVIGKIDPRSIVFNITPRGLEQSDCAVYLAKTDGSPDYDSPQDHLGLVVDGKAQCREIFRRIGQGVNLVSEGPLSIKSENLFWSNHPDPALRSKLARPGIDKIALFDLLHEVNSKDFLVSNDMSKFIMYPVRMEKFAFYDLVEFASEVIDPVTGWVEVWSLNSDAVSDPRTIEFGLEIAVPSEISGWKTISYDRRAEMAETAKAEYGFVELDELIQYICSIQVEFGFSELGTECSIPSFGRIDTIRPIVVSNRKKNE